VCVGSTPRSKEEEAAVGIFIHCQDNNNDKDETTASSPSLQLQLLSSCIDIREHIYRINTTTSGKSIQHKTKTVGKDAISIGAVQQRQEVKPTVQADTKKHPS